LLVLATVRAAVSDPAQATVALAWADPEAAERAEGPGRAELAEDRQGEMEHQEFEEVRTSQVNRNCIEFWMYGFTPGTEARNWFGFIFIMIPGIHLMATALEPH
jgi:hypothetical protein